MPRKDIRDIISKEEILNNAFVAFMIYLERFDKQIGEKVLDNDALFEIIIDKINNSPFYTFVYDDLINDKKDKEEYEFNRFSDHCTSYVKGNEPISSKEYGEDSIIGAITKYAIDSNDKKELSKPVMPGYTNDSKEEVSQKLDALVATISNALNSGDNHLFYLNRLCDSIEFGEMENGFKKKILNIPVIHMNTLKSIYEYISVQFADLFIPGSKHTFGYGWSLLPSIGKNIMIDFDSRDPHDRSWFYQETERHNKLKRDKNKNFK